ncbi:MAG: hypothetical protein R6V54_11635 [Desulfobacteraceae bacterium]
MGVLSFFSPPAPEALEKKGDAFFNTSAAGPAKVEYEKALARHHKKKAEDPDFPKRIQKKISEASEALALKHKEKGEELVSANCQKEAKELFSLAMELTRSSGMKQELQRLMETDSDVSLLPAGSPGEEGGEAGVSETKPAGDDHLHDENEVFAILCHAMPEEERNAYQGYGQEFVKGFVQLNNGAFAAAAENLTRALEINKAEKNFIPLELATCCMNMGEYARAKALAHEFLKEFPESLKGIRLLCDLLWQSEDHEAVDQLLLSCSSAISDTLFIHLLKGENLFRAGEFARAEAFYLDLIQARGREQALLDALAKTCDAAGKSEEALELYRELINTCFSCGVMPPMELKKDFAETSFRAGEHTAELLEIYFGLLEQDRENSALYFSRIASVHGTLGNREEAEKFRLLAEKV